MTSPASIRGKRVQDNTTLVSETRISGTRVVQIGIVIVVAILTVTAILLFTYLPDANAFNAAVEEIFVVNDALTTSESIRILEILAQSGTAFSKVLASYRAIIFVLILFATALLVACLIFLVTIITLNKRMGEIEKSGIQEIGRASCRERV